MSAKETFIQKIKAEVARAQADLERYTALGMGFTGAAKQKHDKHVEELEKKLDETKAKLRELGEDEELVWQEMRDGVMSTWRALQSALKDAVETFRSAPPVAGLHGDEKSAYPYSDSLSGRLTKKSKIEKGA